MVRGMPRLAPAGLFPTRLTYSSWVSLLLDATHVDMVFPHEPNRFGLLAPSAYQVPIIIVSRLLLVWAVLIS